MNNEIWPSWAKVNLTLHVTGQRPDGYHELDSLVVRVGIGDRLSFEPSQTMALHVTGPRADGVPRDGRNLILRAANLMHPDCAMLIQLEKHLPNAAGVGGGSANAATTLLALQALRGYDLPGDLASLGADVPVCLSNRPQRMQGIGERLSFVGNVPPLWVVLVNPGVSIATPDVFSRLTHKNNMPMPTHLPSFRGVDGFLSFLSEQRNDLQAPALKIAPEISSVLNTLDDSLLARMSGSGATCFGLYADELAAGDALSRIRQDHPHWWADCGMLLNESSSAAPGVGEALSRFAGGKPTI